MVRMSADCQQTSVFCQIAIQMADPGACWEISRPSDFYGKLP